MHNKVGFTHGAIYHEPLFLLGCRKELGMATKTVPRVQTVPVNETDVHVDTFAAAKENKVKATAQVPPTIVDGANVFSILTFWFMQNLIQSKISSKIAQMVILDEIMRVPAGWIG